MFASISFTIVIMLTFLTEFDNKIPTAIIYILVALVGLGFNGKLIIYKITGTNPSLSSYLL